MTNLNQSNIWISRTSEGSIFYSCSIRILTSILMCALISVAWISQVEYDRRENLDEIDVNKNSKKSLFQQNIMILRAPGNGLLAERAHLSSQTTPFSLTMVCQQPIVCYKKRRFQKKNSKIHKKRHFVRAFIQFQFRLVYPSFNGRHAFLTSVYNSFSK